MEPGLIVASQGNEYLLEALFSFVEGKQLHVGKSM